MYFLDIIVKDEEIGYSVSSRVISCLDLCATSFAKFNAKTSDMFCRKAQKTRVTCFARPVHNANKSYETGYKADVERASGDIATTCLPSRLSRVRAPSPALTSTSIPLKSPSQADFRASTIRK
jgi:hypothetical protein